MLIDKNFIPVRSWVSILFLWNVSRFRSSKLRGTWTTFKRKCFNSLSFDDFKIKQEWMMSQGKRSGLTRAYCVYVFIWCVYFQLVEHYRYVYSLYCQSVTNGFEVCEISTTRCHACYCFTATYTLPFATRLTDLLVPLGHPWISNRIRF